MKRKSVATTIAAYLSLRTLVVLLPLALLVLSAAANTASGGGNSANAKLCQHGGWQHVQGMDGTRFVNQGDCVSYAAHGGTLVPIPSPAISATVRTDTLCTPTCGPVFFITVTGTGFTPGGTVPLDMDFLNGVTLIGFDVTVADATGTIGPYTVNQGGIIPCGSAGNPQQATIIATDDASGLQASTTVAVLCPQ